MVAPSVPQEYLGIFLFLIFSLLFGTLTLFLGRFFRFSRPYQGKTDRLRVRQ
jgi:NADH-quinone oxidoreductase subunit A